MSYLTSDFITLSSQRCSKSKNSVAPEKHGRLGQGTQAPVKNTKNLCLFQSKQFKQDAIKQGLNLTNKTPPLILFVNLLMKHGKKTQALRVLSMTLSLFKARISRINLTKQVYSLKPFSPFFYQYFFHPFFVPWQKTCSTLFLSNYNLVSSNFYVVFSRKPILNPSVYSGHACPKGQPKEQPKAAFPSNEIFSWFIKYRKQFPFISNFCLVFDNFYTKKMFFCGKFVNFKHFKILEKPKQPLYIFSKKTKTTGLDLKKALESGFCRASTLTLLPLKKTSIVCFAKKGGNNLVSETFKDKDDLKKCLWYKTISKKPSWDKLTNAQKNTFLFCLYKAISNVKPPLECRTKRIGGTNKQIPSQVSEHRQWGIAIRWIIEAAQNEFSKKKNKTVKSQAKLQQFYKPNSASILETFENQHQSKFPRGLLFLRMQSKNIVSNPVSESVHCKQSTWRPWLIEENKKAINHLLQKKTNKNLKVFSPKIRNYHFCFFLAESLENAYYKKGPAMQKRNLWVETALANRAFLRFRWW